MTRPFLTIPWQLRRYLKLAEVLVRDRRLGSLGRDADDKMSSVGRSGTTFQRVREDLTTLVELLKAYATGEYRDVPSKSLLLVAAACWWARGREGAAGRTARLAVAMVAVIAVIGVVAQHLPVFHQHNTEVWFLVAPVHLGAAFAAFASTSRGTASTGRLDVRA